VLRATASRRAARPSSGCCRCTGARATGTHTAQPTS
jgi:hypothetical protein